MKRFSTCLSLVLLVADVPMEAFAMESPPTPEPVGQTAVPGSQPRQLDTIVVSGSAAGPGMWKISKGDHVLWVLGTAPVLPSGVEWKGDKVRVVLEQADAVLREPGVSVGADVGLFRGLLMLPSAMRAIKNPDGKTLREVLPAPTYARWAVLKQRYIGRDGGVEKKRPLFAAEELYSEAIKRSGFGGDTVSRMVDEVMKRRKMKRTPTDLNITIKDPKAAIADFRKESFGPEEQVCLTRTMDAVENDLPRMIRYANAWAIGDMEILRAMSLTDRSACWTAWANTDAARKRGANDIEARIRGKWLEVAETELAKNKVTFAMLPMPELLSENGYLASLRAKGYAVEDPL